MDEEALSARTLRILDIEMMDDMSVAAMKRIGPLGRLQLVDDITQSCLLLMQARARHQHPEWTPEQVQQAVAERVRCAAD